MFKGITFTIPADLFKVQQIVFIIAKIFIVHKMQLSLHQDGNAQHDNSNGKLGHHQAFSQHAAAYRCGQFTF
ncbi:hypothetical protein GALL_505090 [mine drainage metagenome]|uniref:Uncharacterized protein n=1 Tax=mine drainage metagenome TaxID=410659 RepID=A0A1J5PWD6_9ZZZZ